MSWPIFSLSMATFERDEQSPLRVWVMSWVLLWRLWEFLWAAPLPTLGLGL